MLETKGARFLTPERYFTDYISKQKWKSAEARLTFLKL